MKTYLDGLQAAKAICVNRARASRKAANNMASDKERSDFMADSLEAFFCVEAIQNEIEKTPA